MVDLLRTLINPLIERPEEAEIEIIEDRGGYTLRLQVHPDDMGRVIGRGGKRAQAIRSILKAKGNVTGDRIMLDIVD